MKRLTSILLGLLVAVTTLAGCNQNEGAGSAATDGDVTTIEFWAAPNPTQEVYWKNIAEAFEAEHDDIRVNVSQMQETPSSEAGILTAIAGGSTPTMSENISRSFAAQLADNEAIVPLNELDGWEDIVENRNMNEVMKGWEFKGGNQYVLPIYSNAMLFAWRIDILTELGVDEIPLTYSEVFEVAEKLQEKYPNKQLWAREELAQEDGWMRWFDFFMLYNAASNGNRFIDGEEFVADDEAGIATLSFLQELTEMGTLLAQSITDPFENGESILTELGSPKFSAWTERFPELQYGENFVLSRPPVPDGQDTENPMTFEDTKGIVIYASATDEEREAALTFLNWVYSNDENDLAWMETTSLAPARDDLVSNDIFVNYFEENPQMIPFAEGIPYSVPSINNANWNELQVILSKKAVNPVVRGEIGAEEAWNNMREAIGEALQ